MSGDKIVIDTSLIINLFNGVIEVQELIAGRDLFVSIITEIEVLSFPNLKPEDSGLLNEFLSECYMLNNLKGFANVNLDITVTFTKAVIKAKVSA